MEELRKGAPYLARLLSGVVKKGAPNTPHLMVLVSSSPNCTLFSVPIECSR
jgi:hypothetical protein